MLAWDVSYFSPYRIPAKSAHDNSTTFEFLDISAIGLPISRGDYALTNRGIKFTLPVPDSVKLCCLDSRHVEAAMPICFDRYWDQSGSTGREIAVLKVGLGMDSMTGGRVSRSLEATRLGEQVH